MHVSAHYHPSIFAPTGISQTGWGEERVGLAHDGWHRGWNSSLSPRSAVCVTFTSKVGAKGDSDGQLVCNTLHGVVWQPGQRVQLLPGVRGRGNAFFRAAEQHDITTDIQGALDLTRWHGRGHWRVEREQYHHSYTEDIKTDQGSSKKVIQMSLLHQKLILKSAMDFKTQNTEVERRTSFTS